MRGGNPPTQGLDAPDQDGSEISAILEAVGNLTASRRKDYMYARHTSPFLVTLLSLAALASIGNTCSVQAQTGEVLLSCPANAEARAGSAVKVSCTLQNLGKRSIYLLNQDPVLEGPRAPEVPYVYRCTGCGRYGRHENTLQYNKAEVGTLDLPILFHPTIHLRLKDLERLRKLGAGEKRDVQLSWQLDREQFPLLGEWLTQLKLIYLPASEATDLLRRDLSPICRAVLRRALDKGDGHSPLKLVPFREPDTLSNFDAAGNQIPNKPPSSPAPSKSRGVAYNGCQDVISERFQDVFSNVWKLKVNGSA